jgi:hypothetical protein
MLKMVLLTLAVVAEALDTIALAVMLAVLVVQVTAELLTGHRR